MNDQKQTAMESFTLSKSDEIGELAKGLLAFHKAVGTIAKTATNPFFKSSYAPLTEILAAIAEPLQKAGLVVSQFPDGENGLSTMLIHAESGQWMSAWYQINPGKEGPQALGSAITYARRYSIGAVLSLNIDDDDDGNSASGNGKKEKPKKPERRHYNDQPKLRAQIAAKIMDMCPETDKAAKAAHAKNKLKKMAAEYIVSEGTEGQQKAWGNLIIDSMGSLPDAMIEGFYRFIAEEKYEPEPEPGDSEDKNRPQFLAYAIAELNKQKSTHGIQSIVTRYPQFVEDVRFKKALQQVEANIRATSQTAQEQL